MPETKKNLDFPEKFDAEYLKGWDDDVPATCHQFTSEDNSNRKYVSPDGHYEVIYDKNDQLVTDPRDVGTYNEYSPTDHPILHICHDVVPWIIWGNSEDDTTTWFERVLSMF